MELDCAIVGGGLQGGLVALALLRARPGARVAVIERGPAFGGSHTWSFHAGDLPGEAAHFVEPLVAARWPAYEVSFPDRSRRFGDPYASITSERLDHALRAALGAGALLETAVEEVGCDRVLLAGGRTIEARLVVDARGPDALPVGGRCAWQKFAGVELRLPRAPELPMLMDARVSQEDGLRFIYVLPLAPDRVLVEDTRFSLSPVMDAAALAADAIAWAARRGLAGEEVRREHGVLPLPLDAMPAFDPRGPLRLGYGGGFFHPTTGYSFPAAVRAALAVAGGPLEEAGARVQALAARLRPQQRFGMLLNRLLFAATREPERWRVLSRFHALPAPTVRRFYALETTAADRIRILCGAPPRGLSLRRALAEVSA